MEFVRCPVTETMELIPSDLVGSLQFAMRSRRSFIAGQSKEIWHRLPIASRKPAARVFGIALSFTVMLSVAAGYGQVGPAEISSPVLKAAEQAYLSQMLEVNRAVGRIKFPFGFVMSRYAGLSPKEQIGTDARGLEFVRFHDRTVLKLTGNYNAAYNADLLTPNQRADRVFDEVVMPILRLLPEHFTPRDQFDAIGFEIAYHIRTHGHGFDYEAKEILVLVIDKVDALTSAAGNNVAKQQEILNRSEIYLDGKPFGLALGLRDPFDAEALQHSVRNHPTPATAIETAAQPPVPRQQAAPDPPSLPATLDGLRVKWPGSVAPPKESPPRDAPDASSGSNPDSLQKKYQAQIDQLATDGVAKHHFVDYAPPSFIFFRNQIAMQLTLRNPSRFDRDGTSIYKRAAQSFDLFLAPQLKPILDKIPDCPELSALDITIIDDLAAKAGQSSEALEFVLPLKLLRRFEDFEITNQELIDQSVVLVNGVRIALNLQLVE